MYAMNGLLFKVEATKNFASLALSITELFQVATGVTASVVTGSDVPLLLMAETAN